MDPKLTARVDALKGVDPDRAGASRADLLTDYQAFQDAIKAIAEPVKGDIDNLPLDDFAAVESLCDKRDAVKARLDALPDPSAVKARVTQGDAYLNQPGRRPMLGKSVKGTGEEPKADADVKARVEPGMSEFEKAVERGPFQSLAHFAYAARDGAIKARTGQAPRADIAEWGGTVRKSDAAIKALYGDDVKAVTGLNEFFDNEGGILVPLQFADGIWKRSMEEDFNILSYVSPIPVQGNSLKVRARDDKSRADGARSGGVLGYWLAEGGQGTNVKPTYRTISLTLNKVMILIPASEELLEDSTAAESEIMGTAADELRFQINDALINGNGVGKPMGMLSATCKVTVTRGTASRITGVDIDAMWARRAKASGQGMMWLGNQAIEPDLAFLNYTTTNTAATWAYTPGSAFNGGNMPRLKGKDVVYNEYCANLGTSGDLILFDPSAIACAVKSTGVRSAVSTHLRFDYDESVFKFTYRIDARPYWDAALTRFKGSNTLSPIIVLN
jgi:HK97 family phage major capsid protein